MGEISRGLQEWGGEAGKGSLDRLCRQCWVAGRVLWAGEDSEHSQGRQMDFENYMKATQRMPGQAPRGRAVTAP